MKYGQKAGLTTESSRVRSVRYRWEVRKEWEVQRCSVSDRKTGHVAKEEETRERAGDSGPVLAGSLRAPSKWPAMQVFSKLTCCHAGIRFSAYIRFSSTHSFSYSILGKNSETHTRGFNSSLRRLQFSANNAKNSANSIYLADLDSDLVTRFATEKSSLTSLISGYILAPLIFHGLPW